MIWKNGKKKALTLSYDDAIIHDRRFIELLKKYGINCTFNINSGWLNDKEEDVDYSKEPCEERKHIKVSRDEVKSLYGDFEVASHAVHHPNLVGMPKDEVYSEIKDDVKALSEMTGQSVKGFAYPYGAYDDELIERLADCGIVYARTVNSTHGFGLPERFLAWHPTCHHNDEKLFDLAKEFIESKDEGLLFYLWGHSYEFYMDKNWDVIEKFLALMAEHKDEIWMATNIEIYDYVMENRD